MISLHSLVRGTVFAGCAMLSIPQAVAAIDRAQAESIFQQAAVICARDGGRLWGHTLCGPMLLVDPDDHSVVANQADAGHVLTPSGPVFEGTLPLSEPLSDTTLSWSGTRWCELLWPWPMREDPDMRHVTLAHELFHRIQVNDLHFSQSDGDNRHLDTLDGRYLIKLEWRALAAALRASDTGTRRRAATDAVLFRQERYRMFPDAAANEAALESNEGIAEYTGVRLGLTTAEQRTHYALRDLSAYLDAPSLVRSFAYATGPAYGLLLDQGDPGWRTRFAAQPLATRFDERLSTALKLAPADFSTLNAREAVYDSNASLHAAEVDREQHKQVRLASFRASLVEGPLLVFPLTHANFEFKPQDVVPLGDAGVVYPTIRLTDTWGMLKVDGGGLLIREGAKSAAVSAAGFDSTMLKGQGLTLTLKPGWRFQPGERKGDLKLTD